MRTSAFGGLGWLAVIWSPACTHEELASDLDSPPPAERDIDCGRSEFYGILGPVPAYDLSFADAMARSSHMTCEWRIGGMPFVLTLGPYERFEVVFHSSVPYPTDSSCVERILFDALLTLQTDERAEAFVVPATLHLYPGSMSIFIGFDVESANIPPGGGSIGAFDEMFVLVSGIGADLQHFRQHAGLTQREAAIRLGVAHGTVGEAEAAARRPLSPALAEALTLASRG